MKIQMGAGTARILRKKGVYNSIHSEVRAIEFSEKCLESILKRNDSRLLEEYAIIYIPHKKEYDVNFFLRRKGK